MLFEQAGTAMQKQGDIPKAVLLWGNSAVALMKAENYDAAANTYERILSAAKTLSQKKVFGIYKNLARCRANLNQRALQIYALERLLKALNSPQELADIYAMQGDAYRALELYRPAASCYDKAIALLPAGSAPETGAKDAHSPWAMPWKPWGLRDSNPASGERSNTAKGCFSTATAG